MTKRIRIYDLIEGRDAFIVRIVADHTRMVRAFNDDDDDDHVTPATWKAGQPRHQPLHVCIEEAKRKGNVKPDIAYQNVSTTSPAAQCIAAKRTPSQWLWKKRYR
jgi:hypothetical protein